MRQKQEHKTEKAVVDGAFQRSCLGGCERVIRDETGTQYSCVILVRLFKKRTFGYGRL